MRQRTATAVAVLALVMAGTAACGGESSGTDKPADAKKPERQSTAPASPTPAPSDPARPAAPQKDLSKAELEAAILAKGDVPGFNAGPLEAPPAQGETPDKAECAPITAVINGKPEPIAQASAYRQLTGAKDDRPAVSEFLTSHGAQGAATVLSRLRTAVEACGGGFRASGAEGPSTYKSVKALPVARVGDDAFAYQVTGDFEGIPVPLVFQVVRSGGTLATFYTANLEGPQTPRIPPALLTAQTAKLK
ncbi:hypothetical protein HRW23_03415 [Streptomyces lunaelactis]|uniref:hypothetical protein n=2 Tax=Streptomyces lunaelactis TaxID=1535768 RepID=UPI0015853F27|nr:hypothetical protein [Streptomyces lunaelactis]NUK06339.1 hypothetical protein [Streptomyces lunaelactis]NUK12400.1 hypothetical protein [Streptomyces lunaelactis]NUK17733.1 hypothetical protein [Streptomyces lunaelactis]NUK38509.1 hypothetical protein [Streptomyces lunaelactis]NUK45786.1 hypothetical protein [Streptomyces lunaelactis]